jgi:hypothetical protein
VDKCWESGEVWRSVQGREEEVRGRRAMGTHVEISSLYKLISPNFIPTPYVVLHRISPHSVPPQSWQLL